MRKLYNFYEGKKKTNFKMFYVIFDFLMIMISITPLMIEFEDETILTIELITVSYFIIDYLLRLSVSTLRYKKGNLSYLKYIVSFYAIIDVLAILPVFLAVNAALKSLRVLRLVKTFRFFKLFRYSKSVQLLGKVFKKESGLLITVLVFSLLFIFISALMIYQYEHVSQPELFSNFFDAIWWSLSTLTTVGYGDIFPITTEGRIIAMVISFFGVAIVALPSGIIAAGLISELGNNEEKTI
jgi:voltage-gated potassium channel